MGDVYSIHDAMSWAADNDAELDKSRLACTDSTIKMLNRMSPETSKKLWNTGCWIEEILEGLGADKQTIHDMQFAMGQRAFGGDPWAISVAYVNEFIANGGTEEKPGVELADKINSEMFGETSDGSE